MTPLLRRLGRHASLVLSAGLVAALALPSLSHLMRPLLPLFVFLLYTIAMTRIDMAAVFRRARRPRRLLTLAAVAGGYLVLTPLAVSALASLFDAPLATTHALVFIALAPPIASSAALCFMLRLDADFALEFTLFAGLLTPIVGPLTAAALIGQGGAIDGLALARGLAILVAASLAAATLLRRVLGPEAIQRNGDLFDGISALAMVAFLIPLFDGVLARIIAHPGEIAALLGLAVALNFGLQIAAALIGRLAAAPPTAGALGLMWGNRNVGLYLAVMPENTLLWLLAATYQVPMYFGPALLTRFYRAFRR